MNPKRFLAVLSTCFALVIALHPPVRAAAATSPASSSQSTGTITGRVQNIATGQYLNNVQVAVKNTPFTTLTDSLGQFRLVNVPPGSVVLDVFYTGLDRQQIPLTVAAGQTLERNINLTNAERYGKADEAIKLDPLVISAGREMEGEALAINEQRFAPNIKDVVATDSLGVVVGDSVGQFLRFLPGLTPEGSGEVVGISARGFPSTMTGVAMDGMSTVSEADGSGNSRTVNLLSFSLNNISRIEVTKVPLPSSPADSMSGSINMVTKSSFERAGAELRYSFNVLGNSNEFEWGKTPESSEYYNRKIKFGFDFDYTLPINKNLGIVVTGMTTNRYTFQEPLTTIYNAGGTSTGASPDRPYRQMITMNDFPRNIERKSASIKVDWRPMPHSVLTAGFQVTEWFVNNTNHAWSANIGTNGTPSVAGGVSLSYGDDFTVGPTGRGAISLAPTYQGRFQPTKVGNINYRFDDGKWKIDASASLSDSKASYRNFDHHRFYSANITLRTPFRVTFRGNLPDTPNLPATIEAFNNANQPIDLYNIENYQLTIARDHEFDKHTTMKIGKVDVRRRLDFLPVPASVQVGGMQSIQERDATWKDHNYTFNGTSLTPFLARVHIWDAGVPGYEGLPWLSMHRMYSAWRENPGLFTSTAAQVVAAEVARITNSEALKEKVSSLYLQGEARFLQNRLLVLTGVRYERTDGEGRGQLFDPSAAFQRAPNGAFLRNAAGARLRRPEAGAAGSMDELRLTRQERAAFSSRTYDGFFPSFHATYNLRPNLQVRAAFAQTYGRPNFASIVPRTTVNEADLTPEQLSNPNALPGTITVRNTGLRPWSADNFDLTLEHYSSSGGLASVGVFTKNIKDFFGDDVRLATQSDLEALDLDAQYLGWQINTQFNSGDARVRGVEFNVRQPLRPLGEWGRYFMVFANATKLDIDGSSQGDFGEFIPETVNWGFSFSWKRVSVVARWNYRGDVPGGAVAALGPDAMQYTPANTRLDLSFSYEFHRRLRFVAGFTNVTNEPLKTVRYGSVTPAYARPHTLRNQGIPISLSLKGTF